MDIYSQDSKNKILLLAERKDLTLPEISEKTKVPFEYLYGYLYKNRKFDKVAFKRIAVLLAGSMIEFEITIS